MSIVVVAGAVVYGGWIAYQMDRGSDVSYDVPTQTIVEKIKADEIAQAQQKIKEAEAQLQAEEDKYKKEKKSEEKKHEDLVATETARNEAELARIEAELDRIRAVRMSFISASTQTASSTP